MGLIATWRHPTYERFVQSSFWGLLLTLLFGTVWFWPWYVTWPLALAALLEWRPAGLVTVAFTATALLMYAGIVLRAAAVYMILPIVVLLTWLLWQECYLRARFFCSWVGCPRGLRGLLNACSEFRGR